MLTNDPTPRRGFLGRLALAAFLTPSLSRSLGAEAVPPPASAGPHNDDWLDALKGKHRTVFDVETPKNGHVLVQGKDYLDNWQKAFDVPQHEVNLVIGVHGVGIPLVLNDALWSRFHLGEQYGIDDPATGARAVRNVFTAANVQPKGPVTADETVEALQDRGVLFLVCMNTVRAATHKLVAAGMGTSEQVQSAILGGILPRVVLVPAMVIAFTQMQERGIAYVYAG